MAVLLAGLCARQCGKRKDKIEVDDIRDLAARKELVDVVMEKGDLEKLMP